MEGRVSQNLEIGPSFYLRKCRKLPVFSHKIKLGPK